LYGAPEHLHSLHDLGARNQLPPHLSKPQLEQLALKVRRAGPDDGGLKLQIRNTAARATQIRHTPATEPIEPVAKHHHSNIGPDLSPVPSTIQRFPANLAVAYPLRYPTPRHTAPLCEVSLRNNRIQHFRPPGAPQCIVYEIIFAIN
jgi:hypothetical protein